MTRRPPGSRRPIAAVADDDRQGSFSDIRVEGIAVVDAALDKLTEEITEECIGALAAHLDCVGLPADLSNAHELRAAIRKAVHENLYGALRQRVAEIEADPTMAVSLRGAGRREGLLAILQSYAL